MCCSKIQSLNNVAHAFLKAFKISKLQVFFKYLLLFSLNFKNLWFLVLRLLIHRNWIASRILLFIFKQLTKRLFKFPVYLSFNDHVIFFVFVNYLIDILFWNPNFFADIISCHQNLLFETTSRQSIDLEFFTLIFFNINFMLIRFFDIKNLSSLF